MNKWTVSPTMEAVLFSAGAETDFMVERVKMAQVWKDFVEVMFARSAIVERVCAMRRVACVSRICRERELLAIFIFIFFKTIENVTEEKCNKLRI